MKYLLIFVGLLCLAGCRSTTPESLKAERACRMRCLMDAQDKGIIDCYWSRDKEPNIKYGTLDECEAE